MVECKDHRSQLLWLLGACLDCMLLGIKSPLGLGFFLHSLTFQLHVSDSLYSQALAFSQVPSGIEFNKVHMELPDLISRVLNLYYYEFLLI